MKKNILFSIVLLFGIAILSTGCIKADSTITFDNHDNMKVETTVLFPRELMAYSDNNTSNEDLTKDITTIIDGANIETEVQEVDTKDGIGNKRIEICKNISKIKKVEKIAFIVPKTTGTSVLTIKNYIFFKKYLFDGKLEESEKVKSSETNMNPNDLISSKIKIQLPTQAIWIKANTAIKDTDNNNTYIWKIDYTEVNPINVEFCMLNWYAIIGTVIVLLLLTLSLFYSGKGNFDFSAILAKSKKFFENNVPSKAKNSTTEIKTIVKSKQKGNPVKFIVISLLILIIIGVSVFFSLPTICNLLVDNSIKNVYVGEIATATKMVEVANVINLDKNTDLSVEIFAKGVAEIENNDNKTAKAFFDLVTKTKTQNNKKYATELTNKAIKALNQNQLSKCKSLTEAATKFDIETVKKNTPEYSKKYLDLFTAKKYQEALIVSDILLLLNSENHEHWFRKGLTLMNLNKNKEAIEAFTKAINLRKDFGVAYMNRGLIYFNKLSEYDKALEDFNKVISFSFDKKQMAIARLSMAKINLKKKNYRKAMDEAWMAKDLYNALGNFEMADESYNLFEYAAQLECDRPNGYCY